MNLARVVDENVVVKSLRRTEKIFLKVIKDSTILRNRDNLLLIVANMKKQNDIDQEREIKQIKDKKIITYFLDEIKVCQTMSLNTFNISRKVVRTVISKRKDGNIVESDNRRKSVSNKKYNDDLMAKVK